MKKLYHLSAFVVLALAGPAVAAPAQYPTQQARISTSGLDLRTADGVKSLELRIARAAAELCGQPSSLDALGWKKAQRCHEDIRTAAAAQRDAAIAMATGPGRDIVASAR